MNIKLLLLFTATILILSTQLWAQQVPSRMEFANMDLRLTAGAIKDIQADVDALTRSEKYFQKKLERVDMYMPIIERIFKEEGLPEDFKYLVIQESALVSDAVSSSNAVGFWQFKEISGLENDLRIDRLIDERMNIVSSSRAAATYLKDHNKYFDNWAYALIAYQRGRGGAADVIDDNNFGKSRLKITSDSYWYLKKFLAHKVAFENAIGTSKPPYYLKEVDNVKGTTLKEIAKEENISTELIEEYNKWIKRGKIPEDKNYTVIVPLSNLEKIEKLQSKKKMALENTPGDIDDSQQQNFPLIDNYPSRSDRSIPHEVEINGLDGIYAPAGYTVKKLAETAGVDEFKFRRWNDLKIREELKTGKIYYLRRKRNRAKFYYHTVSQNENMWEISQKYGVKLKKLYRKNRMEPPQDPKEGRVLWLRHNRPSNIPIEYREAPQKKEEAEITESSESQEKKNSEEIILEKKEEKPQEVLLDSISSEDPRVVQDSTITTPTENLPKEEELSVNQTDSIDSEAKAISDKDTTTTRETELAVEEENSESDLEDENELDESDEFDQNDFVEYAIKKGDTFFSIANRFNMKISTLLNVNELEIRDTLSIGQIIKVNKDGYVVEASKVVTEATQEKPKENQTEEPISETVKGSIKHKVTSGDTMYALAKKYNVSLKEIMEWNNKQDYNLKEGELILIKQK
ncbi:LysM peptidoglycan-binding domain-containing protein [Marivirga salinae]|uniref:LysM peptidoglycan-binding domain-containing protein n=1 Tax=Marivirga salinarum TaxID=3059078 RepID=A0AA51NCY3_9BACT|nr:LysM peptidoglycan-binding domain-containing protein [Marivirga sp. BDSF4-3]WMN13072.1 LysM peptidoglycan-binding domain-containing protein [Marivirga sp. BDSF4-3]